MPAIASSLSSFEEEGMQNAVDATVQLIEYALGVLPVVPENLVCPMSIYQNHMLVDGQLSKIILHGKRPD